MSLSSQSSSMVIIKINVFPSHESFSCSFNNKKSFGDLKNFLEIEHKIMKKTYYLTMNDHILNDDMVLKDSGIKNDSVVNAIRDDYIKISVEVKDDEDKVQIIQKCILISDLKVVTADKNKIVKNEEIKRVIHLLNDVSSDRIAVLNDLNTLYDNLYPEYDEIGKTFLELDFLSSAMKIFENEKEGDENVVSLLIVLLNKIYKRELKKEGMDLYKSKDAVDPLYYIVLNNKHDEVKEDAVKIIIIIAKKYPSDVINNNNIKNSYKNILQSNRDYSDEKKKFIYILFKELIKEGIIKKGEEGSEIIEEILFIGEMLTEKKDRLIIEEELSNEINNYVIISKEKGFESKVWKNKNELVVEDLYTDWMNVCRRDDVNTENKEQGEIKEEEKEKVKKLCNSVTSQTYDIQIEFIKKICNIVLDGDKHEDEGAYLVSKKHGLFIYYYLPYLFKTFRFEETLYKFLRIVNAKMPGYYEYIIQLYNEMIQRMMKEKKEIEINEENIMIIMFLCSVIIEEGKKEEEIEYLVNSSMKVLENLARIGEEKEEELITEKDKNKEETKVSTNRNEMLFCKLLIFIVYDLGESSDDKEYVQEDGILIKFFLRIVKNHLKNERLLIQKGNIKKIIEYIIYSYFENDSYAFDVFNEYSFDENHDTSNLLSFSSPSFPFSHKTIVDTLINIYDYCIDIYNNRLIQKEVLINMLEVLNNYADIVKIIDECDIKKETEGELLIKWDNSIVNRIKKKISFSWEKVYNIFSYYLSSLDISSFNEKNNNIIKRMINIAFVHSDNHKYYYEKEKKDNKDTGEMLLMRPFIVDEYIRENLIDKIFLPITDNVYYSIFDIYYLINKSEEGCNIINIFMKELSGEIVDRIKKREGNNIIKERRKYERERFENVYKGILNLFANIVQNTFKKRNNVYLGYNKKKVSYAKKEKEIKEIKHYISDIIEEEDMKECLILYLKHIISYNHELSYLSQYSNNALYYLLFLNMLEGW